MIQSRLKDAHQFFTTFRKPQHATWFSCCHGCEMSLMTFDVVDSVILHTANTIIGVSTKLINQYAGPYKIVA